MHAGSQPQGGAPGAEAAPVLRTDAELAELKRQWLADPCWDIEETEGFEAHRHELTAFRLRNEIEAKASLDLKAWQLGLTVPGYARLRAIEERLDALESR